MAADWAVIEQRLDQAIALLKSAQPGAAELLDASALPESADGVDLAALRKKAMLVRALAGQAAGFYRGIEGLDPSRVVGYTPTGVEHAL